MKAIILVAGYATRLYPLTKNTPKALLPVGGKPIIDYILDQIETVPAVNEIIVVSNHKFYDQFQGWAQAHTGTKPITVLDDGSTSEESRLGAIGDILFAVTKKDIQEDIMVVAGDNFFTFSLQEYYAFYQKRQANCICVKEFDDLELLKQFGVAVLDEEDKVIGLEEKPAHPKSNTAVYATYLYQAETVSLFAEYIKEGNKADAPGYFLEWLYKRRPVYAFRFQEECYDIGTPKSYQEICKKYEK